MSLSISPIRTGFHKPSPRFSGTSPNLETALSPFNNKDHVKAEALGNQVYLLSGNGTQIKVIKSANPLAMNDKNRYILDIQDMQGNALFKISVTETPVGNNFNYSFLQYLDGGLTHRLYNSELQPIGNIAHAIRQISPHPIMLNDIQQGFDDPSQIQVKSQSGNTYVLQGKNNTTIKVTPTPHSLNPNVMYLRIEDTTGAHAYTIALEVLGSLGGNKQYEAMITRSGPDEKRTADNDLSFKDLQAFYNIAVKTKAL